MKATVMGYYYSCFSCWWWLVLVVAAMATLCSTTTNATTQEEVQKRYCCHLSEQELNSMKGLHPSCPLFEWRTLIINGGDKCDECPVGTCRLRSDLDHSSDGCLCPQDFMDVQVSPWGYVNREGCRTNYEGKDWPDTVGIFNPSLRSCVTTTESPTSSPTCGLTCANGGIFQPETCSCQCPTRFQGDSCAACSQHYYGLPACQVYCKASETCSGLGVCAADGQSCVCNDGQFGLDCSCTAQNCAAGGAAAACSGNGSCVNSTCTCNAGFVGCACELECTDAGTCSGHGKCRLSDATCQCDAGFVGTDCATLDLSTYCSSGQTVSGNPCLPGVIDILGYGYNAIEASKTNPVTVLTFAEGRVFTVDGKTYEIPDNVQCSPVTSSESGFSTSSFKSTLDYRRYKANSVGLSGEMNAADKGGYMSGNRDYEDIYQRSFANDRHLFASELNHGLYTCAISDNVEPILTPAVSRSLETLTGNRLVERIGTHYVKEVTFGGRLSVFTFVEKCVFASESTQTVRSEIDGSVYFLAGAASAEGSFTSTSSTSEACSVFDSHARYLKKVDGGRRQLMILSTEATDVSDFHEWISSIQESPADIRFDTIEPIDVIVPELTIAMVQGYVAQFDPPEVESTEGGEGGVGCSLPSDCNNKSNGATHSDLRHMTRAASIVGALLVVLCVW